MRIEKLKKLMSEKQIDLSLIISFGESPDSNMTYLSGFSGIGILAILKGKAPFLIVPEMEYEKAISTTKLTVFRAEKRRKILETLVYLLEKDKNKIRRVGIDESIVTLSIYRKLKKALRGRYSNVEPLCSLLRMQKDDEEIKSIQKACSVTDSVFSKIIKNFKFKTEKELSNFIVEEIKKKNCDLAFPPIVASGKGSSQPHYVGNKKIKKGFLLLDFGAKHNGYCADMSRTLCVGTPSDAAKKDYALVLDTVLKCENAAAKTKKFSSLYTLAYKNLKEDAQYFTHGLGHGLGLDIHEAPSLTVDDKNTIKENVPFTIEPGIYFPNLYGIRIEDTVIIKNKKLNVLTKSPKKLIVVNP